MESLILEALRKTNDWDYSNDIVVLMWSHLASQLLMLSLHHILSTHNVLNAIAKNVSLVYSVLVYRWMLDYSTIVSIVIA